MRLNKLIIHGFKSFADRVEISFEDGITGVVGPNGCGKSNIADAVRWVLGEQSAKTLRGAKMEDIIFNGTEKRRRLAFCEVTLVFNNEDHSLPLEFAEVSVTRRVYRSGEGEYKLNGNVCRLKDIVDLFRDTGIGKEGYSLIGQGRIDEILSAKSEDRRHIFEEAAGIVKYKTRKQEAQKRMESTRQNLDRVEDILSELEDRVEPLKAQSEMAREYLQLREEQKRLDLNVFLVRTERYQARIQELKSGMETMDESIGQSNRALASASEERDRMQESLGEYEVSTAESREKVQELIRQVEAREGSTQVLRERMGALSADRDRLSKQLSAANEGTDGIRRRIDELAQQIQQEEASIRENAAALSGHEGALSQAEARLAEMEARSEALKQQIIRAMNRLGDVKSQRARLSAMQNALESQLQSMHQDKDREDFGAKSLQEQVDAEQDALTRETQRREELNRQTEEISQRVRAFNEHGNALSVRLNELTAKRQQKDSRLKLLKEMQRDYEGYNNSVKQVLLYARRAPNSGVHGVVADLIDVPAKLERAVDMVLGAALQNVVVDRDENAKHMIEYLRANRFGRATFLPIGSVRGRTLTPQERQVLSMPGCVGLASELVAFDPKYQGVVDNLLGRTVVAEDLNSGIAIQRAGKYQFRLVTLEGDVMHSGGSMTGGSVQSRMTSLLSRSREISETEQELGKIDAELNAGKAEMEQLEAGRADLKRERAEAFDELHRQEVACARAEAQLKAALDEQRSHQARIQRAEQERSRLEDQLKDVTASLNGLEVDQQSAQDNTESSQQEVKRLQKDIFDARTQAEGLREQVADGRVRLASDRRGLEAARADRERLIAQEKDTARLREESGAALADCGRKMETCATELERDIAALAEEKEQLNLARQEFDAREKRRTDAQKRLMEVNERVEALRGQLEDLSDRRHRGEVQLTRVEGEFKQMNDRIWEDYELTYAGAEPFREAEFRLNDSEKRLAEIRGRIKQMGVVNVAALDEYRTTVARVEEMSAQRDDLLSAQADLEGIIQELEKKMEVKFREEFAHMNENFQRTFVKLFGGGKAELRLSDPNDALNCGIDIVAQPPGKKLQLLSLLSGGERALTAIAILFAMLDLKPTPFCILDEIEAALDDANIDNYADYLKAYSANTQFVVITHRKGTMERCDALYGVVMEEKGVSKTISVELGEAS